MQTNTAELVHFRYIFIKLKTQGLQKVSEARLGKQIQKGTGKNPKSKRQAKFRNTNSKDTLQKHTKENTRQKDTRFDDELSKKEGNTQTNTRGRES